jgi:uncharacterized membrane protein YbhN (UPF0104 family)
MSPGRKKFLNLVFRVLVTIILLLLVLSQININQLGQTTRTVKVQFLFVVWFLSVVNNWVRAAKLKFILKEQQCDVSLSVLFGATAITALYGMIIPGTLSTGVKWYILKEHSKKGMQVFSAIVYNQATNIVFMVLLGLIAVIIANPTSTLLLPAVSAALAVITVVGTILVISKTTGPKINTLLRYVVKVLPKRMRPKAEGTFRKIEIFQTISWSFHLKAFAYNALQDLLSILVFVFAAKAAGADVPIMALIWQCFAIALLAMLPISIANLGVREFTLVQTMAKYGVAGPTALLFSAVIFSTRILMAAVGAVYQVSWTFSRKWR